jgi:hypothetical protein
MTIGLVHPAYNPYFSVGIVFFSYNKSANSVFQPAYQHSRTEPLWRGQLGGDVTATSPMVTSPLNRSTTILSLLRARAD